MSASTSNQSALDAALDAAAAAGRLLRRAFHRPNPADDVAGKARADREAEDLIRRRLCEAFPDAGFRAEERPDEGRRPRTPEAGLWLVDPNDGTSAFQKGHRGASVSIALIRDGVPVLGVVYAYCAPDDRGDLFAWAEGCGPLTRNGEPVATPAWPKTLSADDTVFVSNSADAHPLENARAIAPARYMPVPGIAYRLALTAAGDGVAATSLFHPRDFDYAAGHALLRAVGGVLLDERGQPITYDMTRPTRSGFCFGGAPAVCSALARYDWQPVMRSPRMKTMSYDLVRPDPAALSDDAERLARAQGAWLGQLIGDALGAQVERRSATEIDRLWPHGVNALVDGGTHRTIAGQMTDDGELATLLARVLVAEQCYDANAAARAYRFWLDTGPFEIGNTIFQALAAFDPAAPAASLRAAANRESRECGALMRVAPLAIAGHAWPEKMLVAAARDDASLTHPDPICTDANAAYALGVAFAVREGAAPDRVYSHTVAGAKALELHPAVIAALEAADGPLDGVSPVEAALHGAFRQLLCADDFANAMMDTVGAGGDTCACVTGALLGAVFGRERLPFLWRDRVMTCRPMNGLDQVYRPRPRAFWPVDALTLAERLLTLS